jgi:hypothetical protein
VPLTLRSKKTLRKSAFRNENHLTSRFQGQDNVFPFGFIGKKRSFFTMLSGNSIVRHAARVKTFFVLFFTFLHFFAATESQVLARVTLSQDLRVISGGKLFPFNVLSPKRIFANETLRSQIPALSPGLHVSDDKSPRHFREQEFFDPLAAFFTSRRHRCFNAEYRRAGWSPRDIPQPRAVNPCGRRGAPSHYSLPGSGRTFLCKTSASSHPQGRSSLICKNRSLRAILGRVMVSPMRRAVPLLRFRRVV